jgi:Sugar-transfer associated ATP-grasp
VRLVDRQELARVARRLADELRDAAANPTGLSRRRQLAIWRRGFPQRQAMMYDFERYGIDAYVSEFERQRRLPRLNRGGHSLVRDKLLSYFFLREIGTPTPKVLGLIHDGRAFMLDGHGADDLEALLRERGRLIVKPRDGAFGRRVRLLEHSDGRTLVNGREVADVLAAIDGPAIVSEHVTQHAYADAVFAGSLNTIRVVCLRDPRGGEPFAVHAFHRFGTERSRPVDNISSGGLAAGIDLDTGRIGELLAETGFYLPPGEPPQVMPEHPDTGATVQGTVVPRWDEILAELNRTMLRLPGLNWVGWDVAVTPDGFTVVEGNGGTDITFQTWRPLLADERVEKIFEANGLLTWRRRIRRG